MLTIDDSIIAQLYRFYFINRDQLSKHLPYHGAFSEVQNGIYTN